MILRSAVADYPHVAALKDGRVRSDRVTFDREAVNPITRAFRRMARTGDFDPCEIAPTALAQAEAAGKALTAWLGAELPRLFACAKATATEPAAKARYIPIVGPGPLPYGLAANRTGIEPCLRYAAEQGLVPREYRPEDLFFTG